MPTYDYVCDSCGHAFEQWQSFHDATLTTCPNCKKKKLRRLIGTGAALVFKGSGFYETDYKRDDNYKAAEKAEADAASAKPGETKKDTSTDGGAKPAESTPPTAPEKPAAASTPKKGKKAK